MKTTAKIALYIFSANAGLRVGERLADILFDSRLADLPTPDLTTAGALVAFFCVLTLPLVFAIPKRERQ